MVPARIERYRWRSSGAMTDSNSATAAARHAQETNSGYRQLNLAIQVYWRLKTYRRREPQDVGGV